MCTYLAATLPPLTLKDAPPWTPSDFLFHCQGALSTDDWRELSLIVEDRAGEGGSPFALWWHGLDTQIRNAQARIRAGRMNVDARPYTRLFSGFDVTAEQAVLTAMNASNPLEREYQMDRSRWNALDDRVRDKRFTFEEVAAYAIRLRILSRWARLDEAAGLERIELFITENADKSLELQRLGGA